MLNLFETWVLDVTNWPHRVFYPVEQDQETVMFGMSLVANRPPAGARVVGILHEDGQEQAEAWARAHMDVVEELFNDDTGNDAIDGD